MNSVDKLIVKKHIFQNKQNNSENIDLVLHFAGVCLA